MNALVFTQDFGGDGSARIRVRMKRWKGQTWIPDGGYVRHQFVPTQPFKYPDSFLSQPYRCPKCGSPGACGNILCSAWVACGTVGNPVPPWHAISTADAR